MKNIIKLLLLTPMTISLFGCKSKKPEPKPVDVVLISGQSNGVGIAHTNCITKSIGASKYQEYLKGYEGIQIAYDCWTKDWINDLVTFYSQNKSKDDTFTKVMLGQGNSLATFGPEVGIAEATYEKHGGKLFLIKFACGASNLKDDWMEKNSQMYKRFVDYVERQIQNLKNMGYEPTIKAMCWMQGEGDSYDGYYQMYYENTKKFVENLRHDLRDYSGDKEFAFIDAAINNYPTRWEYYEEVNAAKKKFADESDNNFFIDTIAAGMHTDQEPFGDPDKDHYDSESQILLGHLFTENFEQFLME